MEEVRNHGKIVYIKNIFEITDEKMRTPRSFYPPGHKLQKPSKESGII